MRRSPGLDFSEPAVEAIRSPAANLALDATFVTADVCDAVTALDGQQFDFLGEHDLDAFQRFQPLGRRGSEYCFPAEQPQVPLMFSLRATRRRAPPSGPAPGSRESRKAPPD